MIRADMHIHTYCSDGLQTPKDVISAAKSRGVGLIAVTDHDNMNATEEVLSLAKEGGIIAVPGIEISAYTGVKVHVLGYNVDRDCAAYRAYYERTVKGAEERTADILAKLKRCGYNLSMQDILREKKCAASPIHVMHVARAAARKGYGKSPADFYLSCLNSGKCAYSSLGRPTPHEAVRVIGECGGFASVAHPGRITLDDDKKEELIKELISCGLRGIEAVYSGHTDRDTAYFKELARRYNLLVTGGSDTHFTEGNRSVGIPEFYPDGELLCALGIE
ncbi:MAG: PHP domain-containing protein [Candidatus Coproplasma sp.]